MKRMAILFMVFSFSLIGGICLIAWIGSYWNGFVATIFSPSASGFSFVSIQRGTLAFCYSGPMPGAPTEKHFFWLEATELFDNRPTHILSIDDGHKIMFNSETYPWRWKFIPWTSIPGIEGFVPLWVLAVLAETIPALWALGLFDKKEPKPQIGEKKPSAPLV